MFVAFESGSKVVRKVVRACPKKATKTSDKISLVYANSDIGVLSGNAVSGAL
jgi:hypothetical protein